MKLFGIKKKVSNRLVLKVKRGDLAKEFEMIKIAKDGDVGLDVACVLQYKDGWKAEIDKYIEDCRTTGEKPDDNYMNEIQHGVIVINPGCRALIPTDIRIEVPVGYWASIEARSSTSKQSLVVPKGVIDEGYRGELFAQILNVGNNRVVIRHGDRLVQLIVHERYIKNFDIEEVDELTPSERGESGFGSSGQTAIKQR